MNELQLIWNEVINMLDIQINPVQLKNWILPLRPLGLIGDQLVLDTNSNFIQSMIEKKYKQAIMECMSYLCERPISVILLSPSMENYDRMLAQVEAGILPNVEKPSQNVDALEGKNPVQEKKQEESKRSFAQPESGPEAGSRSSAWSAPISPAGPEDTPSASKEASQALTAASFAAMEEKKKALEAQRQKNGYKTLNPKYTMESFVRGPSNDFAYATAKAVIRQPGVIYNPLFIYGLSGLGKTHLMQAIAHAILLTDPNKKVLYITSENFMNEMIAVIENGTNSEKENFRFKYRSIDVLLIDDIQFIAGKKATMEEVFHTFNDLKEANKQIVLSSDKPPRELKNLEDRLVTRFEGGMTVDIQQPDFETRLAILNHKMKGEPISLPQYVLEYIAGHITANIRELEGALLRVLAYFRFKSQDLDHLSEDDALAMAREALRLSEEANKEVKIEDIIRRVTEFFQLQTNDLTSKSRQSNIVLPRQIAMYLCRVLTNKSLVAIGRSFTRDHTTVMHAVDKIEEMLKNDEAIKADVDALKDQLTHL